MPHGVADLFEGIAVSMSRFHMEIQRKEWEKQLWTAPHDWCEPLICFFVLLILKVQGSKPQGVVRPGDGDGESFAHAEEL